MDCTDWIALVGIIFICSRFWIVGWQENKIRKLIKKVKKTGFIVSGKLNAYKHVLLVDDVHRKWVILKHNSKDIRPYDYSQLYEFEIYEDGKSMVRGQVGRRIIGSAFLGFSAKTLGSAAKHKNKLYCSSLQVRVRIQDMNNPEIVIDMLEARIRKNSFLYKKEFEHVKDLAATFCYVQNN